MGSVTLRTHPKAAVRIPKTPNLPKEPSSSRISPEEAHQAGRRIVPPSLEEMEDRSSAAIIRTEERQMHHKDIRDIATYENPERKAPNPPPCQPFANSSSKIEGMRKTEILLATPYVTFRARLLVHLSPSLPPYISHSYFNMTPMETKAR